MRHGQLQYSYFGVLQCILINTDAICVLHWELWIKSPRPLEYCIPPKLFYCALIGVPKIIEICLSGDGGNETLVFCEAQYN